MIVTTEGVLAAIDRYVVASAEQSEALYRTAAVQTKALADERDKLVARMEKRWDWCAANEGHEKFIDREDALIADIRQYEAMEDALRIAERVLLHPEAA